MVLRGLAWIAFAGCGGGDGEGGGGAGGTVEGSITADVDDEPRTFPLRSGVLYIVDVDDGAVRLGFTSFAGAPCAVESWFERGGDWAYTLVNTEDGMGELHFGLQEAGGFHGGFETVRAELDLEVLEPAEGGGAVGTAAFFGFGDEPRGEATFDVPFCGMQAE